MPHEVVDGFDDHTVSRLASVDDFHALAIVGVAGAAAVKFSIAAMTAFDDVRWLDSGFYGLHDEWYWFRLLNGHAVPGFDTEPVAGMQFDTVDAIERWAASVPAAQLPLDLRFIDSAAYGRRLYSDDFYRIGTPRDGRNYGLGTLVLFPDAADGRDHWLIEIEYSDRPTPADIDRYFTLVQATVPSEIADQLEWVIRSPEQDAVALKMVAEQLPRHDRIVRYRDLTPAGQTAVYNPGIAAGRLIVVDGVNTTLNDTTVEDIVLIEHVPDSLPPAAALITDSQQTPLAHVNILARNRGIPNASQSGLLDDPGLRQAARVRGYAVVRAGADGTLAIALITREQYDGWHQQAALDPIAVPAVDRSALPTIVDLTPLAPTITSDDDIERWRPIIGGKAAGFLTLLAAPGVTAPPDPLAITVRPYLEHLDQVVGPLAAMLADPDFNAAAPARFLFLEGPDDFAEAYPDQVDLAADVIGRHRAGSSLRAILDAGGFRRFFGDVPMRPDTLAEITAALRAQYGDYAVTQGIRFRSSSSVEDIEGFNGAGLYESNTGFLDPEAAGEDPDRSVEERIKRTWSSYWSFEAFEERRLEQVDHLSGAMAVLVHARFDDPLELNNGVATLTLLPDHHPDQAVAVINVQAGAVSVTNPDPTTGDLPEVVEVRISDADTFRIDRRAHSTLVLTGDVLDDRAVGELVTQLKSTAELWRRNINRTLPVAEQIDTVVLDYEFDTVAPGWPDILGERLPSRLVVTQARSLDPGLRGVPDSVRALPVPRDILALSASVRRVCGSEGAMIEVLTDPLRVPDVGYTQQPFVVPLDSINCTDATLYATSEYRLVELLEAGVAVT